jgi:hypothetical protein
MEREITLFLFKSFIVLNKVIPFYRIVGGRHNGGGEGIADAPRSVR